MPFRIGLNGFRQNASETPKTQQTRRDTHALPHTGLTPAARVERAVNGVKCMITTMIEVLSLVMRIFYVFSTRPPG